MTETALVGFAAALFAIMNPVGNIGVFATPTEGRDGADARHAALTCAVASAITLLIVTWGGDYVLDFFGISVNSLRVAGGVIVLLIGLSMLTNNDVHRHTQAERDDAKTRPSVGVVPLAIPIVSGPGTMATVLVVAQHQPTLNKIEISGVVLALAVLTGLLFSLGKPRIAWERQEWRSSRD